MKLVILGGGGKTGVEVVTQGLALGHTVMVLARDGNSLGFTDPKLTVVTGDTRDEATLVSLLAGQDAVISALGTIKAGEELIARSTAALVSAARQTGLRRVVMMSSFLISPNYKDSLIGRLAGVIMKGMNRDKQSGEKLLKQSGLDWTIVYPTTLDRTPAGKAVKIIGSRESVSTSNAIARADVAKFMLERLGDATLYQKAVTITAK